MVIEFSETFEAHLHKDDQKNIHLVCLSKSTLDFVSGKKCTLIDLLIKSNLNVNADE